MPSDASFQSYHYRVVVVRVWGKRKGFDVQLFAMQSLLGPSPASCGVLGCGAFLFFFFFVNMVVHFSGLVLFLLVFCFQVCCLRWCSGTDF